jgi:hypothetical protein
MSTHFISETSEQVSTAFGIEAGMHTKSAAFTFGQYRSNIIPTLYYAYFEEYQLSRRRLIMQKEKRDSVHNWQCLFCLLHRFIVLL